MSERKGRRRPKEAAPSKRVSSVAEVGPPVRVQKMLADLGIASRRTIEQWISEGRVRVDGQVISLGHKVLGNERVSVDEHIVHVPEHAQGRRVIAYNKPPGQIVSNRDPLGRETVLEHLPRLRTGRWIPVGRLDLNTMGLILFTTDGELAARLMHPRWKIQREYSVRVLGAVDDAMLKRLRAGVNLDDGPARLDAVVPAGGEGANRWFNVTLSEGRNREVRRIWETQGVRVSRLIRIRFGAVRLPRKLRPGHFVDIDGDLLAALLQEVHLAASGSGPAGSGRH